MRILLSAVLWQGVFKMIKAKLKLNTDKLSCKISQNVEQCIADSEAFEKLTKSEQSELVGIIDHVLACELAKCSEFDLVAV